MSNVLTDARVGEVAVLLLLAEFKGVPSEHLANAFEDLETELVTLGICTPEEAPAVVQKLLARFQTMQTLSPIMLEVDQEKPASLFARQYPSEVLESIKQLRAREGANTPSH